MKKLMIVIIFVFCLMGCHQKERVNQEEDKNMEMNLVVQDQNYEVELYDNETVQALLEMLPMTITMNELNGNEKYAYFTETFPTDSQSIGMIHVGDLMLFGDNCLVLFYEEFQTSYQYTPIGKVINTDYLKENLGETDVQVIFNKGENENGI